MKYMVKNTINNSIEFFDTKDEVRKYIDSEIKWFSSERELKNNTGYNDDDFIITECTYKFVIADLKCNTGKEFIGQNGENVIEENAKKFDTKDEAESFMKSLANYENWAHITEVEVFE